MVGRRAVGRRAVGRRADCGSSRPQQGVGGGGLVEVLPDGVVVHGRGQRHKHVPDGVGEGDDAVALEEEDAQAVDEPAVGQLVEAVGVALRGGAEKSISTESVAVKLWHGGQIWPGRPIQNHYDC